MRKADYAALAAIIAKHRAEMLRAMQHGTPDAALAAAARHSQAQDIAQEFARVASVDRAQFLKACGIAD